MYQQFKTELENLMRKQSAQIVADIDKQGYGLMAGSMIMLALGKVPDQLYSQLAPMASEMGSTPSELKSFIEKTNMKIMKEYVDF